MSLYNKLFGENEHADRLLIACDLNRDMFARFRDIFPTIDGTKVIVYTRLGGYNRKSYFDTIKEIRNHDLYLTDYDDEYDNTYAYFVFAVPEQYIEAVRELADNITPLTVKEMFEKELKEMDVPGSPAALRAESIAKEIISQADSQPNGGVIWM